MKIRQYSSSLYHRQFHRSSKQTREQTKKKSNQFRKMKLVSVFLCINHLCDYYSICCLRDMVVKKFDHLDSLYSCRFIFQAWLFSTVHQHGLELWSSLAFPFTKKKSTSLQQSDALCKCISFISMHCFLSVLSLLLLS